MAERTRRPPLTTAQKLGIAAVLAVIVLALFLSSRYAESSGRNKAGKEACEIVAEEQCVFDERYGLWVPRSEAG